VCVNLRAPIVINPVSMIGAQIMPERSLLPVRHIMDSGA
jgi:flagellar assembly factor FliW